MPLPYCSPIAHDLRRLLTRNMLRGHTPKVSAEGQAAIWLLFMVVVSVALLSISVDIMVSCGIINTATNPC